MIKKVCLLISVLVFCFLLFLQTSQNQNESYYYSKKVIATMAKAGDGNNGDEDSNSCYWTYKFGGGWVILRCDDCDIVQNVEIRKDGADLCS